jgi:hypothetical protein
MNIQRLAIPPRHRRPIEIVTRVSARRRPPAPLILSIDPASGLAVAGRRLLPPRRLFLLPLALLPLVARARGSEGSAIFGKEGFRRHYSLTIISYRILLSLARGPMPAPFMLLLPPCGLSPVPSAPSAPTSPSPSLTPFSFLFRLRLQCTRRRDFGLVCIGRLIICRGAPKQTRTEERIDKWPDVGGVLSSFPR